MKFYANRALPVKLKNLLLFLPIFLLCLQVAAQEAVQIRGTISDKLNKPLEGVTVTEKGTNNSTVTNQQGVFELRMSNNGILTLSSTGFVAQEMPVSGRTSFLITMETYTGNLDEVVVVGYGTQRRADLTGSVSTIKSKDLENRTVINPLDAISAKVPGLSISNNSGRPGGSMRVAIRGRASIGAGTSPLYVIDGIQGANVEMLDPNEIESIDVLKDASATSIYGVSGSNGVILITTKKAKAGQRNINYNGNVGVGKMARKMDMLDSKGYMEWFKRAWEYDPKRGTAPNMFTYYPELFKADGTPIYNTDWQDEATQTAISNRHHLGITSGTENSKTGIFLGYQNEQGILLNTFQKKYSARFNSEVKVKSWLNIGGSVGFNSIRQNRVDDYQVGTINITRSMVDMLPILPIKYPDGKWGRLSDFGFNFNPDGTPFKAPIFDGENAVRLANELKVDFRTNQVLVNAFADVMLMKGLVWRTTFSAQLFDNKRSSYSGRELLSLGFPAGGWADVQASKLSYNQLESFLNYDQSFSDKHRVSAVLGSTWAETKNEAVGVVARDFPTDFFGYTNLGAARDRLSSSSNFSDFRLNSYFVRGNYTFNNKYLLTATARLDGSSKFGAGNKYAAFPSAGLGWIVSNEDFLSRSKFISFLKFRASYGKTGNSGINPFTSLGTLANASGVLNDAQIVGLGMGRIPNSELRWEQTAQANVGLDLRVLDDRLGLTVDVYNKKTNDLLLNKPVSIVSGFTSVSDNIGSVRNKGVEVSLSADVIRTNELNWNIAANVSANRNKILKLGANNEDIFPGPNFLGQTNILQVGKPVGNFWGIQRAGVWSDKEEVEAAKYNKKPGDIKRLDVNGDYKINSADAMVLGNMYPDYEMNISTALSFKQWELNVEVQIVQGNEILQTSTFTLEDRQWYANSRGTLLKDAWTPTNQNTMVPAVRFGHTDPRGTDLTFFMDGHWVQDGSFIRGRNLSLAYNLPSKAINKIGVKNLRVYGNVQNFFLITDYNGFDPEVESFPGTFAQGIEFNPYPRPRTFTFGVNLNF